MSDLVVGEDGLKGREAMIRGMFSAATTPELQSRILKMMLRAPEATARGAMNTMADPIVFTYTDVPVASALATPRTKVAVTVPFRMSTFAADPTL